MQEQSNQWNRVFIVSGYTKRKRNYLRASVFIRIHYEPTCDYDDLRLSGWLRCGYEVWHPVSPLADGKERAVRAIGQHASSESNVLGRKVSAFAIPWKRVALYATVSVGFFLLGFLPVWFKTTRTIEQRDAAQRGVRLTQLKNTLSAAVIDVQRGQYEPARQLTNDFYSNLRREVDADSASVFTPAQREELKTLLAGRDELITLLAQSDPAATHRLFDVYSTYNKLATNSG